MRPLRLLAAALPLLLVVLACPPVHAADKSPQGADANGDVNAGKTLGGLRYTISVSKFTNTAQWPAAWQMPSDNSGGLGNAYSAVLTNALSESGHFIVLAEKDMTQEAMNEQDQSSDASRFQQGKKTPQKGHMTPAQLLVKGSVTRIAPDKNFINVGSGKSGGAMGAFTDKLKGFGRSKTEVDVTVQIVDATTRQLVASKTVTGATSRLKLGLTNLPYVNGVDVGSNPDMMGAVVNAVNQSVEFLVAQLPKIAWEGTVVSVAGDRVTINRGKREGVSEGTRFDVGSMEVTRDPDTGEVLDTSVSSVATLEVKEVRERVSICSVVGKTGTIATGMTVRPAAAGK